MTIAILCPTRGRPEQCSRMLNSAYSTANNKYDISPYIALTDDDNAYPIIASDTTNTYIKTPDGMPTAYKWNKLSDLAMGYELRDHKLFMLAADDMIFDTPGWDKALLEAYDGKPHVYALRDSRDDNGTPHPIVTREYIEAMGYFLPPIFLHWFVDSWTADIARANNCFTHLKDYLLIHDKPSDKGQADETHNRIRNMGWHERDKWTNEHCQHFLALEKSRLKMRMCS